METQVTPQIVEQVNEDAQQIVNEEIPAIAKSQARVTKNPRKIAAGRKGALARKARKLMYNSNIEHSPPIKTWALGVVAIAAVRL